MCPRDRRPPAARAPARRRTAARAALAVPVLATGLAVALLVWLARGEERARSATPAGAARAGVAAAGPSASALDAPPSEEDVARPLAELEPRIDTSSRTAATERVTRLEGVVRDAASDAPLPGATVELFQVPREGGLAPARSATTDAAGRFALVVDPDAGVHLRASAAGHRPATRSLARPAALALELEPCAGILEGHVRAVEGWPLAGALVRARGGEPSVERETRTDADGAFRLEGLPDGEERGRVLVAVQAEGRETIAQELAPPADGTAWRAELVLRPGRTLGPIEVVDTAGAPVEGACVLVLAPGRDAPAAEIARTDATGRAPLAGLPTSACEIAVRAEGLLDGVTPLADGAEERTSAGEPLRVVLEARGRVVGRLVGADGAPLAGRLLFQRAGWPAPRWKHVEGAGGRCEAWTDASGRFEVDALVPETPYDLVLDGPGHATTAARRGLAVAPGQVLDLGALALGRGRTLRGVVLLEPSTPPETVRLGVVGRLADGLPMTWRDVALDAEARFTLRALPEGELTLRGRAGAIERDLRLPPGEDAVALDLRASAATWTLEVSCEDQDGAPVAGAKLLARRSGVPDELLEETAAPGVYRLASVQGTLCVVALQPGSGMLALGGEARLTPAAPAGRLCVERAAELEGRVVAGDSGRAIADATIAWRSLEEAEGAAPARTLRARSAPDGSFRLELPAARAGALVVSAAGFASEQSPLPPLGAGTARRDVVLGRAARIVAEARCAGGEPLVGALVRSSAAETADGRAAESVEALTDAYGRAVLDLSAQGPQRVQLVWGDLVQERDVVVRHGDRLEVAFESVAPGVPVRVSVRDADGALAVRRSVILADANRLFSARTGLDGVARFDALAPGAYRLRVQNREGSGLQSRSVRVPSGAAPLDLEFRLE